VGANVRDAIEVFRLSSEDVMLSILPVFHSFGQMVNFWLPMVCGMTAVTYANPLDYKTIPSLMRETKSTMIAATPIFFSGYLRESKPGDFDSAKIMIAGADKVPDWLRDGFQKKHNKILLEGYGVTETSPVISANTPWANRPGSIGKVFPGIEAKVVGLEKGEALPAGQEGKIVVKGEYVMKGYYDDVEETSLRLKDGWYDTGDMGVLDEEGYLWHRGRLKRFVKIGGEMVSLVRSEAVLEKILPDGVACCVVDIPDPKKGARLAAAVTQKVNERDVIKKMSEELPNINIPTQFIVFDELPKMGSGKIDFRTTTEMVRKRLEKK
jgi:acyl-[acyl-carrier-protein]-phospholipid O-acyltransferase/long-chain-fatty-acid--[acyl-carrier-protein] ligase